ncbi:DUF4132 domain-containing protein [Streptomyces phyllanthi]|uniref:DUF4132 domain-containing protein n=1 Tax=Streptomyces phyllanthi TaxID=1803180 RepID=A0A5N8W3E1_9ACTN|nr:DUF4132 domain-containing protein [Streptomyces phyllanthi]MPY40665.1 DUF4132 domain-containing protein [Streptomyces phyllanthi]
MVDHVEDLLVTGNRWAERIRGRVTNLSPDLEALVLHLAACGAFWDWHYKVDAAWKRQTKALLKAEGARELVYEAIRQLAAGGSLHDCTDPAVGYQELVDKERPSPTRDLAYGFALAAGYLERGAAPGDLEALVGDLVTVARKNAFVLDGYYKRDDSLSGAVFTSLAELRAMDALWTLHREVQPSAHCHKLLFRMVKKTAARLGVPPHQLAERTVPTHGLDADGTLRLGWRGRGAVWINVPYEVVITLESPGRVTVDWIDVDEGGATTRTTAPFRSPTGFKARYLPHNVDVTRHLANALETTLRSELGRVYALSHEERVWPHGEWARYYRDHPVTGLFTRRLIWEYETPHGTWEPALPVPGTGFVTLGGDTRTVPDTTRIRLWKQNRADDEQIGALRAFLADRQVSQPYDQVGAAA